MALIWVLLIETCLRNLDKKLPRRYSMGQLFIFRFIENSCQCKTISERSHAPLHQRWAPKQWQQRAKQFSYSAIRGDTCQDSRNKQFKYPKAPQITWRMEKQMRISAGDIDFLGRDCCSQQPQLLHQWDQHPTTTPFFHPSPLFDLDSSEEDRQWKHRISEGSSKNTHNKGFTSGVHATKNFRDSEGMQSSLGSLHRCPHADQHHPRAPPQPHVTLQPSWPRQQNPLGDLGCASPPGTLCTKGLAVTVSKNCYYRTSKARKHKKTI